MQACFTNAVLVILYACQIARLPHLVIGVWILTFHFTTYLSFYYSYFYHLIISEGNLLAQALSEAVMFSFIVPQLDSGVFPDVNLI